MDKHFKKQPYNEKHSSKEADALSCTGLNPKISQK